MGLKVKMSHDIDITCDRIGCANSFHATWVEHVADSLNQARSEGWWIGHHVNQKPPDPTFLAPPTLTYCPHHHEETDHAVVRGGPDREADEERSGGWRDREADPVPDPSVGA